MNRRYFVQTALFILLLMVLNLSACLAGDRTPQTGEGQPATTPTPFSTSTMTASSSSDHVHDAETDDTSRVMYTRGESLRSLPANRAFDHPELQTLFASLQGELGRFVTTHRPVASPQGRYVVVMSPCNAMCPTWLADLQTGALRELSDRPLWVSWSPDGRHLTYVQDDTLYTVAVHDDSEPDVLFHREGLVRFFARWSPAGDWIAVAHQTNSGNDQSAEQVYEYLLVSPESGDTRTLGHFPIAGVEVLPTDMSWSPDGTRLATPSRVVLTPEGRSVSFAEIVNDWSDILNTASDWLPPALVEPVLENEVGTVHGSAVSHDGHTIAYARTDEEEERIDIYVFDRATQASTHVGRLDAPFVTDIRWSVDDSRLFVGAVTAEQHGTIYAVPLEMAGEPKLLLQGDRVFLVDVMPAP